MKDKVLESICDEYKNDRSMELYGKPYYSLQIAEITKLDQYIYDINHPIWKDIIIDTIITKYEVNNIGQIRIKENKQLINQYFNRKGYLILSIFYNGKWYTKISHRLVAEAFIPNPENKPQVNHISGIKTCNWVGNLEWNTAKENIQHAVINNLQTHLLGEESNHNIYTESQIHEVCKLLENNNLKNTEISKITGVDVSSISKIKCNETWNHISSLYKIPKAIKNAKGSKSASSKYSDEQIHEVCKLLSNATNKPELVV